MSGSENEYEEEEVVEIAADPSKNEVQLLNNIWEDDMIEKVRILL
jgi:hypothetical protein